MQLQAFEVPRYEAAVAAFQQAFTTEYEEAKRKLAAGELVRLSGGVDSVFTVEVPRNAVLDDQWQGYSFRFTEAGRLAALASRRTGEARLEGPTWEWSTPTLTWAVVL